MEGASLRAKKRSSATGSGKKTSCSSRSLKRSLESVTPSSGNDLAEVKDDVRIRSLIRLLYQLQVGSRLKDGCEARRNLLKEVKDDSAKYCTTMERLVYSAWDAESDIEAAPTAARQMNRPIESCNELLCSTLKSDTRSHKDILAGLTMSLRHRVCGHTFSSDEIAFSCRTCRTDPTCVTCKDCFTNSDHTGHHVHFQRTTAGGCCDCGDVDAWKQSGFCPKHPGPDTADGAATTKTSKEDAVKLLPSGIRLVATTLIDEVMLQLFDVFTYREESFQLAEVLNTFYRELEEVWDEVIQGLFPSTGRSKRNLRNVSTAPHIEAQYLVVLHHDDNHTSAQSSNIIQKAAKSDDKETMELLRAFSNHGECAVMKSDLIHCAPVVADLMDAGYRVSVTPLWHRENEMLAKSLLAWLHSVCSKSDGLSSIVSDAICSKRQPNRISVSSSSSISKKLKNGRSHHFIEKHFRKEFCKTLEAEFGLDVGLWGEKLEQRSKLRMSECPLSDELEVLPVSKPLVKRRRLSKRRQSAPALISDGVSVTQNRLVQQFLCILQQHLPAKLISDKSLVASKNSIIQLCKKSDQERRSGSVLELLVRSALPKRLLDSSCKLFHELILDLDFKSSLMGVFLGSYKETSLSLAKGHTVLEDSIFDFSVQLFSVASLVKKYSNATIQQRGTVVDIVIDALFSVLDIASNALVESDLKSPVRIIRHINAEHPVVLRQGRYRHCIDNLENVLNISGIPKVIMSSNRYLKAWLNVLSLIQCGDGQRRRGTDEHHVEYESDSWVSMFNLGIRLHTLFPFFSRGVDAGDVQSLSVILDAILYRHSLIEDGSSQVSNLDIVLSHPRKSESDDQSFCVPSFKVSKKPTSFHVPLHRFFSAISKRAMYCFPLRDGDPIQPKSVDFSTVFKRIRESENNAFIEYPLRCLVMCAQIRSNLWRRNGEENMMAQIFNYTSLPFCHYFQDADVFVLQLSVLAMNTDFLLSYIVNRFQLCAYFAHVSSVQQDNLTKGEAIAEKYGYDKISDVGMDSQQLMQMVQECFRLLVILGIDAPTCFGRDYQRESLKQEVIHQLCTKIQTRSELCDVCTGVQQGLGSDDSSHDSDLDSVLKEVATYHPPHDLEPGRYELKEEYISEYNPYFMHLSRESHQCARDRWMRSRRTKHKSSGPLPPVLCPKLPIPNMLPIRKVFVSSVTIGLVRSILARLLNKSLELSDTTEAVITISLHLIAYGIYTASDSETKSLVGEKYFKAIYEDSHRHVDGMAQESLLMTLLKLSDEKELVNVHREAIAWILQEFERMDEKCHQVIDEYKKAKKQKEIMEAINEANSPEKTEKEKRKAKQLAARARALAAMAKNQASFMKIVEEDEAKSGQDQEEETEKFDKSCDIKCILCHEAGAQEDLGYVAFIQSSTVLSSSFRPSPKEALDSTLGNASRLKVRKALRQLEYFMPLSEDDIATLRSGPSVDFLDWVNDEDIPSQHDPYYDIDFPSRRQSAITMRFDDIASSDDEVYFGVDSESTDHDHPNTGVVSQHPLWDMTEGEQHAEHGLPHSASKLDAEIGYPVLISPVGIHIKTCHHAVHVPCLERYTTSLYQKNQRGEEFDGCQAIDLDATMNQFLCPLCKTLSNTVIPTQHVTKTDFCSDSEASSDWEKYVLDQRKLETWVRPLVTEDVDQDSDARESSWQASALQFWSDYFEDTLWEPHSSITSSAPFLWASCAFTLASTLVTAETDKGDPAIVLDVHNFESNDVVSRDQDSLSTLIRFCRWSFEMLSKSGESEVNTIFQVAKRCCPLFTESKREERKLNKLLEYASACYSGIVYGLVFADVFTCFVVSFVLSSSLESVFNMAPVFEVAELFDAIRKEFITVDTTNTSGGGNSSKSTKKKRQKKNIISLDANDSNDVSAASIADTLKTMSSSQFQDILLEVKSSSPDSEEYAVLVLLNRMVTDFPENSLKEFTRGELPSIVHRIKKRLDLFHRRSCLFLHCISRIKYNSWLSTYCRPTLFSVAKDCNSVVSDQIWNWCRKRFTTRTSTLSRPDTLMTCPHSGGMRNMYISRMFRVGDVYSSGRMPSLIDLPDQYDKLYCNFVELRCSSCNLVPSEPGLCLICGEIVCCGTSCCKKAYPGGGNVLGECTRHAIECGATTGIFLVLLQCRLLIVSGGMAAHFPCPYVDDHGEEDIGLQRGQPLRLDHNRYRLLQSLWRSNRIASEVSRLRNQQEHQDLIMTGHV